jgi:hypothetical protein
VRGQAIPRGPADPVARFLFCHHELARSEREICISTNAPPRNHRPDWQHTIVRDVSDHRAPREGRHKVAPPATVFSRL